MLKKFLTENEFITAVLERYRGDPGATREAVEWFIVTAIQMTSMRSYISSFVSIWNRPDRHPHRLLLGTQERRQRYDHCT
jgi:hypothetical protein